MKVKVQITAPLSFTVDVPVGETIQSVVQKYVESNVPLLDGEIKIKRFKAPIDISDDEVVGKCASCRKECPESHLNDILVCVHCDDA